MTTNLPPGHPRAGASTADRQSNGVRPDNYSSPEPADQPDELVAAPGHGGVGAPYAHVTAPLRRLADRYATEACLALHQGVPVPEWVKSALPKLPKAMSTASRGASAWSFPSTIERSSSR